MPFLGSLPLASTTYVEPVWILAIKSVVIFIVLMTLVPLVLILERKLLGRFQARYGPNRVGPFGLLQPIADIGKLLAKEHSRPVTAAGALMIAAPVVSVVTAVVTFAIIPFGDVTDILGYEVGLYGIDVNIGILYAFAFGAIGFYGLMLGGWASGSKYSYLGAMRSAAQLISYEVSLGLSLLGVVMLSQSLSLVDIVNSQDHIWYIVPEFVGFLIFVVAGFAETNRAALRPARGRRRAGAGLHDRVRRRPLRLILPGRVHEHADHLGNRHHHVPGWLARALAARRAVGADQDHGLHGLLHLGARHPAAAALRPAHVVRLEDPAAAGHPERAGDRDRGDGGVSTRPEKKAAKPKTKAAKPRKKKAGDQLAADAVVVMRGPEPGGAGGAYRSFGATLRGMRTTFARIVEGPLTIQYPEEKTPVYPRFRGRHRLHRFEDNGLEKCVGCSLCAAACPADCIRVVGGREHPRPPRSRPASATPRSTRST